MQGGLFIKMKFHTREDAEEFIKHRFPKERDEGYKDEWRTRITSGRPTTQMDSKSLKVWKKLHPNDARSKTRRLVSKSIWLQKGGIRW